MSSYHEGRCRAIRNINSEPGPESGPVFDHYEVKAISSVAFSLGHGRGVLRALWSWAGSVSVYSFRVSLPSEEGTTQRVSEGCNPFA